MLNMIRQINDNDSLWRQMLIDMNQKYFYHKTIQTNDVEDFMSSYLNLNLKPIFDQYLRTRFIPVLETKSKNGKRYLRWQNCIDGFEMPLDFVLNGKTYRMNVETEWQAIPGKCKKGKINVNNNYYIK